MLSRLRFALLLPLAALLACGSTSNTPAGTNFAATSGDYVFTVGAGTATAAMFSGNLTVAGSNVTGVLRYNVGSQCVVASQDIAVNGTDTNGLVTLTSAAFSGSVATLNIQLPLFTVSGGQQIANGTAVIAGGTCSRASTTLQAQLIPSFAGNWSGTVSGSGSSTGTASVQITQSGPNSDGQFPASASVSFSSSTNASCSFSTTVSAPATGLVSGATIQLANANSTITVYADASSKPVNFSIGFGGNGTAPGTCFGTYSGALTD